MEVFELVIVLLLVGAGLAALAKRVGAPYPAMLALAGAILALIPGVPTITFDPELALALFVAPVLVDAAFDSSPRDLRANWRSVTSLALGAVIITTAVVAMVVHALVPGMPWAAAVALGAIVAPPDAAAATTVLKRLKMPHSLMVILEGESLFNDASALIIYRLAVGAAVTGAISGFSILPTLLFITVGSVVLGVVCSKITLAVNARIQDLSTAVVVQFCGTFAVWIIAERLHLSGIITMVVYAMIAARSAPKILPARIRIGAWAVWEVAVFVLNVLAFVLVGFQLKPIIANASSTVGTQYFIIAAIVCVSVMAIRIAWVMSAVAVRKWFAARKNQSFRVTHNNLEISYANAALVGWCGMRGTVTLAAALALPLGFPQRDLILATAFGVTVGTLVLQGLTLRPLLKRLNLKDDGAVDREIRLARYKSASAAVAAVAGHEETETTVLVRKSYELQVRTAAAELAKDSASPTQVSDAAKHSLTSLGEDSNDGGALQKAISAQRQELVNLRANNTIGDTAFQRVEEEVDWMELGWAQLSTQDEV
ncbi:MAG: Na+/H+ antiporter [Proteobacteria bacterium]|nr:MAG: Na+/H+ antiporter [Pseudomonadota bacterium]